MNPYIIIHKQHNTFHTKPLHMGAFIMSLQSFFYWNQKFTYLNWADHHCLDVQMEIHPVPPPPARKHLASHDQTQSWWTPRQSACWSQRSLYPHFGVNLLHSSRPANTPIMFKISDQKNIITTGHIQTIHITIRDAADDLSNKRENGTSQK